MYKVLKSGKPFPLESGAVLKEVEITYHTYGEFSSKKDNVIWICHALTANSDAQDWWNGLVGPGKVFDPAYYYIVCANMLGSCYGTTGPASKNPDTNQPYGLNFPLITIRDMVKAHQILQKHLGIDKIKFGLGGSMGGQQVLEWAIEAPDLFEKIGLIATNAVHSPWGIAFNESQRMALFADQTFNAENPDGGYAGMEAARAIGMLSYRSYATYQNTQFEENNEKIDDFRASSYQRYQGLKLRKRFNPYSYYTLGKAMDSHNVGRKRGSIKKALEIVKAKALIIGITSDLLFPIEEQIFLANNIHNAQLVSIESPFGHDGFLVEFDKIEEIIRYFIQETFGTDHKLPPLSRLSESHIPGSELF